MDRSPQNRRGVKPKLDYAVVDTILCTNRLAVGVEVPPWVVDTPAGVRITVPNRSSASFISQNPLSPDGLAKLDGYPHLDLTDGEITEAPSIGTPWKERPFLPAFEYTDEDVAASPVPSDQPWKRNYSSSYSGVVLDGESVGEPMVGREPKLLTFNHSENYSMLVLDQIDHDTYDVPGKPTSYYRSTFYPNTHPKASNLYGQSYFERRVGRRGERLVEIRYPRWDNYSAFVTMSIGGVVGANGRPPVLRNVGPVVWPSRGYCQSEPRAVKSRSIITRWFHAGDAEGEWNLNRYRWAFKPIDDPDLHWFGHAPRDKGVRHPSAIEHNGWVWLFYVDTGAMRPGERSGFPRVGPARTQGLKLARAPIKSLLDGQISHDTFRTYCRDRHWQPSLPEGFDTDRIGEFMSSPGPVATPLFGAHTDRSDGTEITARFAVAKVRGRELFLGVELYSVMPRLATHMALRWSENLIDWSERIPIELDGSGGRLFTFEFKYPVFCDADGRRSDEVDLDEFYILGAAHKQHRYGDPWRHPELLYPFPQMRTYPVNRLRCSLDL